LQLQKGTPTFLKLINPPPTHPCVNTTISKKKSVGSGIISSTMHFKSGYSSNDSSFEKPWPKKVQNVLILKFY
jgi:hypothetical protein